MIRAGDSTSVLVVGHDNGLSSIALANEYPKMEFHTVDVTGRPHCFLKAREIASEGTLRNVKFEDGGQDVVHETRRLDLIALPDCIHLLDDPEWAAAAARRVARRAVFAIMQVVPENPHQALSNGLNPERATALMESRFPRGRIRGCYWIHQGVRLKERLEGLADDQV